MQKNEKNKQKTGLPFWVLPSFLLLTFSIVLFTIVEAESKPELMKPITIDFGPRDQEGTLEGAVLTYLDEQKGSWEAYDWVIDNVIFNPNKDEALLWLAPLDKETQTVLGTEPRKAFAFLPVYSNKWQILLEDDAAFNATLLDSDILSLDTSIHTLPETPENTEADATVYGGYYLPWEAELTKRLTWSISHTSCYEDYCYYAFDFADGTMFPLMAAKGGTVYHWNDACANGATDCTNSITLEDKTTTPWTYQIYLHIAQDSVPAALKEVGTVVKAGQQIANVDDTGYSTGHHVHFMVVAQNTLYCTATSNYCFGRAVDITFRDVSINWDEATQGGRPRLPEEAEEYGGEGQDFYTSGNAFLEDLIYYFPVIFMTD